MSESSRKSPSDPAPANSSSSWLLLLVGFAAFLAVMFLILSRPSRPEDSVGVGQPAPDVELVRLSAEGPEEFLTALPSNQVTLLHLWGTWCGPCRIEYPHLDEMIREIQDEGPLRFLSVSCESGSETFEGLTRKTNDFLEAIGADTESYADPNGATRMNVAKRLGQANIFYPTTVIIDGQGIIRGVWQGYSPNGVSEMRDLVETLWGN